MDLNLGNQTQPSLQSVSPNQNKIWFNILQGFLVVSLLLTIPLCKVFPHSYGWENGPVEWLQVVVLTFGFIISFGFMCFEKNRKFALFWGWTLPIWLIMIARELSWGAAFFPPQSIGVNGPVLITREMLWYGKLVHPIVGIILLGWIVAGIYYRLYSLVIKLFQRKAFPVSVLSIAVIAIIIATLSEKHIFELANGKNMLLEEMLETVFYLGLVLIPIGIKALLPVDIKNDISV